jgi:gliding motility-associated-like protein
LNSITVTVRTPTNETKSYTIRVIRMCGFTVSPSDTTICAGGSATLRAINDETEATFKWYDSQTGGTLLYTGNNYTVFPASTTNYYVSKTILGTESERTEVRVTVVPLPDAPAANNVTACDDGNTHTASATAGTDESVIWYTEATGGSVTIAPNRNSAGTATAYAAAKNNITNCESATRTAVSVTIYELPDAPVANNVTACDDGNTYTASATTGTDESVIWYTEATGGTVTNAPNRNSAGTATAYAAAKNNITNCESATRSAVSVTIYELPDAPVANNVTACDDGNTYTASATAGTDESVIWYTEATGGSVTTAPNRNSAGTATAYAAAKNNITNCESATRTAVSVTINPVYNITVHETICTGESYTFNGNSYTSTGVYTDSLISALGCDSILTLNLDVLQSCNSQEINTDNDYYELTYGDNMFTVTVTASSGLPLTFFTTGTSVNIQNIAAGQYNVQIQETGTTTVTFQQAGDDEFAPAELHVTITVNPAELTIKANDGSIYAGDAFPIFGYTCSGFVYGEDSTVLKKNPTISCSATTTAIPGEYSVIISGAEADNYTIQYINGILKIKKMREKLPNAFSPYNKDEINDIFGENYDLMIFNRWGILLFKGNNGWDGKYKGKLVTPGVYYYYAKDSNGNIYKGSVMVIKYH